MSRIGKKSIEAPSGVKIGVASGEVVVGAAALSLALTAPERTVATFKRWMGENRRVELGGREFTPEELSSLVLRSLCEDSVSEFRTLTANESCGHAALFL